MLLAQDKWVSFVKHAAPDRRLPWLSNYIFKQQYKPFPKLKGLFKYLLPTYGIFILLAAAINNPGSSKLSVVCLFLDKYSRKGLPSDSAVNNPPAM